MRVGLFGGTFDPVHYGHLLLAECCREQGRLDEIRFIPAATPPHKRREDLSPSTHRIEMLKLAIAGHPRFAIDLMEIERGGVSYTVDTLKTWKAKSPADELFFLMGTDSLADFPTWREPETICRLATPLIVCRPGAPLPDFTPLESFLPPQRIAEVQRSRVDMPQIDLSSTEIRRRVAAGKSIRFRTPRAVEEYILHHRLYCDAEKS